MSLTKKCSQHIIELIVIFIFSVILTAECSAEEYQPSTISEIKAQYQLLLKLKEESAIDNDVFLSKTAVLKKQAKEDFNTELDDGIASGNNGQSDVSSKSEDAKTRIDTFSKVLYAISALLLALLAWYILSCCPPLLNEILAYIIAIWGLVSFHNEYLILLFGFLLGGVVYYSTKSRLHSEQNKFAWIGLPLTIVFSCLALIFDNSIFGFCSVLSFLFSFKFVISIYPDMITVSSSDDEIVVVLQLTIYSFILSLFVWIVFYTPLLSEFLELSVHLRPFEIGMLTLFPLSYFVGISQLRFFLLDERAMLRLLAEIVGLASELIIIFIALIYQLNTMFWIGAIFLTWNFLDKFYYVVVERYGFVIACGVFSMLFALSAAVIEHYIDSILPYLLFLGS